MSGNDPHFFRDDGAPAKLRGLAPKHVRKTVFADIETTGFSLSSQIIDMAAIKCNYSGEVLDTFSEKCAVSDLALQWAEPGALNVVAFGDPRHDGTGDEARAVLRKRHEGCRPMADVLRDFVEFVRGCAWVGWNAEADVLRFIGTTFVDGVYWTHGTCFPWTCLEHLARSMPRFAHWKKYSLESACTHLGIPPEKEHRAITGAKACKAVWDAIVRCD